MPTDMLQTVEKTPGENLSYGFDWTAWLAGDVINTSSWVVPAGLTVGTNGFTNTTTSQRLSGGTSGVSYTITNHITTVAGNQGERSMVIQLVDTKGQ